VCDVAWGIVYYERTDRTVPAADFLLACPTNVRARLAAVLEAVRAAPPPAFSGGGKWEAMHGSMGGYYEIRVTGPGRRHYRLYCLLDNATRAELAQRGFDRPQIAVINDRRSGVRGRDGDVVLRRCLQEARATTRRRLPGDTSASCCLVAVAQNRLVHAEATTGIEPV
jgi:hypothetical protein